MSVQAVKDSAKSFAKDDESRETGGLDQAAFWHRMGCELTRVELVCGTWWLKPTDQTISASLRQ
jgi:hypothetical protein